MTEQIASTLAPTKQLPRHRTKDQIAILSVPGHAAADETPGLGVRLDRVWSRKGEHTRTNAQLVDAIEWYRERRGKAMSDHDAALNDELERRTWGVREAIAVRMRVLPSWLGDALPRRRSAGYVHFLGLVIAAYRAGACGLLLSYSEAMGLCQVGSEGTWKRWCDEWEAAGLVRRTQTWVADPVRPQSRMHGKLLYRLGPTLDHHALALLEGAIEGDGTVARDARLAAAAQRRAYRSRARAAMRDHFSRRAPYNDQRRVPTARVIEDDETLVADGIADAAEQRSCNGNYMQALADPVHAPTTPLSAALTATLSPTLRVQGKFTAPGGADEKASSARRPTKRNRAALPAARCERRRSYGEVKAALRQRLLSNAEQGHDPVKGPPSTSSPVGHVRQPDSHAACGADVRGGIVATSQASPAEKSAILDATKQRLLELYRKTAMDPASLRRSCEGLGMSPDEAHAEVRAWLKTRKAQVSGPAPTPPQAPTQLSFSSHIDMLEQFTSHLADPAKAGKNFFFVDQGE